MTIFNLFRNSKIIKKIQKMQVKKDIHYNYWKTKVQYTVRRFTLMLVCLLPIPSHCHPVTQGWNKNWTSQNAMSITVLLFLKLKVRSISTSQQNGPQNRWHRIMAYTSLHWIKISLLCTVTEVSTVWEGGGVWAPLILSHSLELFILHWEQSS